MSGFPRILGCFGFPNTWSSSGSIFRVRVGFGYQKCRVVGYPNTSLFEGNEESAENFAVSFKGSIVLSKHVDLAKGVVFSKKKPKKNRSNRIFANYLAKFYSILKSSSDWLPNQKSSKIKIKVRKIVIFNTEFLT